MTSRSPARSTQGPKRSRYRRPSPTRSRGRPGRLDLFRVRGASHDERRHGVEVFHRPEHREQAVRSPVAIEARLGVRARDLEVARPQRALDEIAAIRRRGVHRPRVHPEVRLDADHVVRRRHRRGDRPADHGGDRPRVRLEQEVVQAVDDATDRGAIRSAHPVDQPLEHRRDRVGHLDEPGVAKILEEVPRPRA